VLAISLLVGQNAFTEESSIAPSDAFKSKPEETADDVLTNDNLRAYSGSTSTLSIASIWNYNGGTLASPLSEFRPNISHESGNTDRSDLDGNISAKYNLSAVHSVMIGTGVRWIAPLKVGGLSGYNGTRYDAINPFVQYQYIYKWFGVQSVLQAQFMKWTQADQTAYGYNYQLNIDQENMYEIGKSGVSVGASVWGQYQWFNKHGSFGDPNDPNNYVDDLATQQSTWEFSVGPELEYQLTEKLSFRTLLSLINIEHYASYPRALMATNDRIYDSIGIGYSWTRDIYLYPNIQWLPGDIAIKQTNVSLQATINVF
jgi:hypothetical protein